MPLPQPHEDLTDAALVARVLDGHRADFELLVRRRAACAGSPAASRAAAS
jgi:hypothetical protein